MGDRFSNLHFSSMRHFTQKLHTWKTRGPIELTQQIMCNLNYWNSRASKEASAKTLVCYDQSCDEEDCGIVESPERRSLSDRSFQPLIHGHQRRHHHHRHNIQRRTMKGNDSGLPVLEKRVSLSRDYDVELVGADGQKHTVTVTLPEVCIGMRTYLAID
jgi:hypothetical protein